MRQQRFEFPRKVCKKCAVEKPLTEFRPTDVGTKDGHRNECRECERAGLRKRRRESDIPRQLDNQRYHNDPKRRAYADEHARNWRVRNPEKARAHSYVAMAIRVGKIEKKPCEICGALKVHAHHGDYSKPLDIRWLCPRHHALLHAGVEI